MTSEEQDNRPMVKFESIGVEAPCEPRIPRHSGAIGYYNHLVIHNDGLQNHLTWYLDDLEERYRNSGATIPREHIPTHGAAVRMPRGDTGHVHYFILNTEGDKTREIFETGCIEALVLFNHVSSGDQRLFTALRENGIDVYSNQVKSPVAFCLAGLVALERAGIPIDSLDLNGSKPRGYNTALKIWQENRK